MKIGNVGPWVVSVALRRKCSRVILSCAERIRDSGMCFSTRNFAVGRWSRSRAS
jgi:hypothetical protein